MPVSFSAIPAERSEEVLHFVLEVFGAAEIPENFSPEMRTWKYFAPHPWWPTGRSYVLEEERGIAAHCGIAPVRFIWGTEILDTKVGIDWASGRLIAGAGLLVSQHCMELGNGTLLAVGGSDDTLRVLTRWKSFAPKPEMRWYAKPLKPWSRFRLSQRGLRDSLKLARNLHWKVLPPLPSAGNWSCRQGHADDQIVTPSGDFVPILRTRAWIDYLLACPAVNCQLWILQLNGEARGHALVSNVQGSARVADFALEGNVNTEQSTHAFSALLRSLEAQDDLLEVVAASSLPEEGRAFEACGLRHLHCSIVFLADLRKTFPPEAWLEVKPILGDSFYLCKPSDPFQL